MLLVLQIALGVAIGGAIVKYPHQVGLFVAGLLALFAFLCVVAFILWLVVVGVAIAYGYFLESTKDMAPLGRVFVAAVPFVGLVVLYIRYRIDARENPKYRGWIGKR